MSSLKFQLPTKIQKVDTNLGLVMGWAIISKVNGEPFVDSQNNYIPEESMLNAAVDFMQNSRMAKDMHEEDGELPGEVLFAWPMTTEVAKAYGIEVSQTGLMIAMRPDSPEILAKYESGEYTGFSIGGHHIQVDDMNVEDLGNA